MYSFLKAEGIVSKNRCTRQNLFVEVWVQMIIFEDGDRNTMEWGGVVHVLVEVTWRAGTLKLVSSLEPGRMLCASGAVMSSLNKWTDPCLRIIDLKNISYLVLTCVDLKGRRRTFSQRVWAKKAMYTATEKENFVFLGVTFSWKLSQRLTLGKAAWLFWYPTSQKEKPILQSSMRGPCHPPRTPC